ncbi:MipA/OmpV family protein [Massilia sp. CF038]|uniref:MipA/OmpV family protein n=1 Tax=Massilia sp. CF038 TaxID=1881045 RepID=UPI00091EEF95|nr:MipA/OmpV family protein [Massilia sp. CF038]SHH23994.1 Outer membrane scaffolding protein for murein synthesis, MipA/OmpV family [Massilia sp. CF038]
MTLSTLLSRTLCAALPLAALSLPVQAEDLPLWEVGVLGGSASTPAYPGSSDRSTRSLVLPFLIYRGEVMRADQSGIGARLFESDRVELDVGLAASLPARSDDVAARAGMPDLGTLLELGPRLKVRLADLSPTSRLRLDIPLRAVLEARSGLRTQGYTFEPKVVYEARGPQGSWTFDANVGMVFGNRKINQYFYEVAPQYATLERPAFEADSGLMLVRTGASASRLINQDLRVFGFVRYESYAGAVNRDSPLMKKETGASIGIGFAYTIKRSAQKAR